MKAEQFMMPYAMSPGLTESMTNSSTLGSRKAGLQRGFEDFDSLTAPAYQYLSVTIDMCDGVYDLSLLYVFECFYGQFYLPAGGGLTLQ